MNICLTTNTRPHTGGVTNYINNLLRGLKKRGNFVRIVSFLDISKERKINLRFTAFLNKSLKETRFKNIKPFIFYLASRVSTDFFFLCSLLIKRWEIVHCMDFFSLNAVFFFCRALKIPFVLSANDVGVKNLVNTGRIAEGGVMEKYLLKEEVRALKRATAIFVSNTRNRDYIISKGVNGNKITVLKHFIDINKFQPDPNLKSDFRKKYGLDKDDFVVLFVGRFIIRKGPIYPLLALKKILVRFEMPSLKLIYVGDGDEKEKVESGVCEKVKDQVRFLGTIDYKELMGIYNMADCLTIPCINYQGEEESQGLTPLEAMSCGLPVIAFRSGGVPEIIKDGQNGVLLEQKDVAGLAAAILKLSQDKDYHSNLSMGARDYIKEYHNSEKQIEIVTNKYKEIIGYGHK